MPTHPFTGEEVSTDHKSFNVKARKIIENILQKNAAKQNKHTQVCAHFAHFFQNCVTHQVLGENVHDSFSCFYIEIAYSNFTFCAVYTLSFLPRHTISAKRAHPVHLLFDFDPTILIELVSMKDNNNLK